MSTGLYSLTTILSLVAVLVASACSAGDTPACRVGSDCASGVCRADGTCAPVDADAGPLPGDGGTPDAPGPACSPDHDGVITRDEVTLAAGLTAPYLIAQDVTVSTAGTYLMDGTRSWDLTGALAGDHVADAVTLPLAGQWFAADFPGASYAAKLRDDADLLGVFEVSQTEDTLLLRGVVSPAGGAQRTELTYDPPIVVLRFPLSPGATFHTDATVTGVALGVFGTYLESYDSLVDAVGMLATPYGVFPVLRLRTDLTRTVGLLVTKVRTYLFASECYGTVATIVSQDNEAAAEFTTAVEVKRLTP